MKKKTTHEWTLEWIREFLTFESQLMDLKSNLKNIEEDVEELESELERLEYLDNKLRYNIRLHELGLTRFMKDYQVSELDKKVEYKDHKELEAAIDRFKEEFHQCKRRIDWLNS